MKQLNFGVAALAVPLILSLTGAAQEFHSGETKSYTKGTGITGIDKLGAHQLGGRSCAGCHAPRSSSTRGNGGTLPPGSGYQLNTTTGLFSWNNRTTINDESDNETVWGQDMGPVLGLTLSTGGGTYHVDLSASATRPRIMTGIVYCLSCHDGNVARGAMMTNQSFEQAAGLLPAGYGSQPIPTLLGSDGGTNGNYANDHPIGPAANVGKLGITSVGQYVDLDSATNPTKLILKNSQPDNKYTTFRANYGLPTVVGSGAGAGFAVEAGMTSANDAYVVCTTCHTPHNMYTASASATNPIAGLTSGTFPSYFFISAPYNPGANTNNGTAASSATQFCRQCHFTDAGGSNEASGIMTIATAF